MNSPTPSPQPLKEGFPQVYRVIIADDHEIFRQGLGMLLSRYPFLQVAGEAANGRELRELVEDINPDLIFLDLNMPVENGFIAATEILKQHPAIRIIVLTFYDDVVTVERMMKLGAAAYITKGMTRKQLEEVLDNVLHNRRYISSDVATSVALTKMSLYEEDQFIHQQSQWLAEELTIREKQVLRMIVQGNTQRQIADTLYLSPRTVETHKIKLMRKMGVKNTAEMIAVAHQYRLV